MKRWEYLPLTLQAVVNTGNTIETNDPEVSKVIKGLNTLGTDGWELAAVLHPLLIFKREVKSDAS